MAKNSVIQLVIDGKDNTKKAFASVDKSLAGISKAALKAGAAIASSLAVATTGIVAKMVRDSTAAADALRKTAQGAGMATETLSGLSWAASQSGVELNMLARASSNLNKGAQEAAGGTGRYAEALGGLGISVADTNGQLKSADVLLLEIADSFESMEDGARKSAIAATLFGRNIGPKMIPFLNAGASGISELTAQAERLGLVISDKQAAASEEFNDNLAILGTVSTGAGNQITHDLLPALNSLTGMLVEIADKGEAAKDVAEGLSTILKMLATAAVVVGASFKATGSIIGATAAAAMSAARGDFKGAAFILKEGVKDYADTTKGAVDRIQKLWDGSYEESNRKRREQAKEGDKLNTTERTYYNRHATELKGTRDKMLTDLKQSHDDMLKQEKNYLSRLEGLKQERIDIEERYDAVIARLGGGTRLDDAEPSYAAATDLKVKARQARQAGDAKGAKEAADAALEMLDAMREAGQNTYGLKGFAKELKEISIGSVGDEKEALAAKLQNVKTSLEAVKTEAESLENMPVSLEMDNESAEQVSAQLQGIVERLSGIAVVPVSIAAGGGSGADLPGYATGGHVRGPGSGTSDSILARLSNGEYVLRAAAVRQYGTNLLDNMNGLKLPKFADGGLVGQAASMNPQQKSIGTLNFNLGGSDAFSVDVAGSSNMDELHRAALKFGRTRK